MKPQITGKALAETIHREIFTDVQGPNVYLAGSFEVFALGWFPAIGYSEEQQWQGRGSMRLSPLLDVGRSFVNEQDLSIDTYIKLFWSSVPDTGINQVHFRLLATDANGNKAHLQVNNVATKFVTGVPDSPRDEWYEATLPASSWANDVGSIDLKRIKSVVFTMRQGLFGWADGNNFWVDAWQRDVKRGGNVEINGVVHGG